MENRFEARRAIAPSPLLGREEELDLLVRRWQQAKAGEGRVVLIAGEPGIGKSRLTRALLERLQAEPHTRLQYHCSPYHQDSALHPIISQLVRAAGMEHEDAADQKLGKLEAFLRRQPRTTTKLWRCWRPCCLSRLGLSMLRWTSVRSAARNLPSGHWSASSRRSLPGSPSS